MAKFVVVNEAPTTLDKGELVVAQPDFIEQIVANQKKAPRNHLTALNHLREILQSISTKYDPELNAMRIRLVNYVGVPYSDNNGLSTLVVQLLKNEYPSIFEKALEHQLKNRPLNTKLVYYVGDSKDTGPFFRAGIDSLDKKDIESYMTGKLKKVVGKPAVTDEEAKNREPQ
jgi:hypothetical protein